MANDLGALLASLPGLEDALPTFREEELSLEVLRDMASDGDDFLSSMDELGIESGAAGRLLSALRAQASGAVDVSDDSTAAVTAVPSSLAAAAVVDEKPAPALAPAPAQLAADLGALLASLPGLEDALPTFREEELSLEVLRDMASDGDDFLSSMDELGIESGAAGRLLSALRAQQPAKSPLTTNARKDAPAPSAPASAVSARDDALVPPPPEMPDEDVVGLVGRRVLITGLTARAELNGQVGTVLFHDMKSGRYTVCTEVAEGEQSVTVALRPTSLDPERAKAVPSKKKSTGPGVYVDHAAADAAAKVAAEIAAKEKAEVEERMRAMAKSQKELETPERADMYRKAANWKKPPEPGSVEAFFKAQNKAKREEEERELAEWKARPENRKIAEQLEAKKQMARDGPLGYNQSSRREAALRGKPAAPTEGAATPPKPVEVTPDLESAMAALAALSRSQQQHQHQPGAAASPLHPAGRSVPSNPTDLLAAALGKVVGGGSGGLGGLGGSPGGSLGGSLGARGVGNSAAAAAAAAAGSAGGGGSSAAAPAHDLLAAALGRAGLGGAPVPAAPAPPPKKEPPKRMGAKPKPLPPHLAAAEERKRQEAAAAAGRNALEAYRKRHYGLEGGAALEADGGMGEGTVDAHVIRARERARQAKEEAEYRNKNAFVGEHFNDI